MTASACSLHCGAGRLVGIFGQGPASPGPTSPPGSDGNVRGPPPHHHPAAHRATLTRRPRPSRECPGALCTRLQVLAGRELVEQGVELRAVAPGLLHLEELLEHAGDTAISTVAAAAAVVACPPRRLAHLPAPVPAGRRGLARRAPRPRQHLEGAGSSPRRGRPGGRRLRQDARPGMGGPRPGCDHLRDLYTCRR